MNENKGISAKAAETSSKKHEEIILNMISNFTSLTAEEVQLIKESIKLKNVEKGTFLIKEGQISAASYVVIEGCVRQYCLKNGEEWTTNFFLEGDSIDLAALTPNNEPSKYYLQCLENCTFSIGDEENEKEMRERYPKFETICRQVAESKLANTSEELSKFIMNSPEERYLHLMNTRPELLNRVPQYQLASYLGMKPESLSRIRKRILEKSKEA